VKTFITMHHPYSFTGQYQYIAATINLKGKENESWSFSPKCQIKL